MSSFKAFPTLIYQNKLLPNVAAGKALNRQLLTEVEDVMGLDVAGHVWSRANYPNGFTSYASANELHKFSSTFGQLEKALNGHVKKFTKELDFDLGGRPLHMTTCWVNVMNANTHHSMHLHPLSVVSGTYYLQMPAGASCLKFEDPRLGFFMGAPPRLDPCRPYNETFVEVNSAAGSLVLFESWLRHEVPLYSGKTPRISISFNYAWGD